jgi:hypothetical protein
MEFKGYNLENETVSANSSPCELPQGFIVSSPPQIEPDSKLVSRTEEIIIGGTLQGVRKKLGDVELKDILVKSRKLPGVVGVKVLTPGGFGAPGTRRLVCLSDGSVTLEQVVDQESERFRYVVWSYTSKMASRISYAVGEFRYIDLHDERTKIEWTYSFKLNQKKFPGNFGRIGAFIFRVSFLDRDYAVLMRDTLAAMKTYAERQ